MEHLKYRIIKQIVINLMWVAQVGAQTHKLDPNGNVLIPWDTRDNTVIR